MALALSNEQALLYCFPHNLFSVHIRATHHHRSGVYDHTLRSYGGYSHEYRLWLQNFWVFHEPGEGLGQVTKSSGFLFSHLYNEDNNDIYCIGFL